MYISYLQRNLLIVSMEHFWKTAEEKRRVIHQYFRYVQILIQYVVPDISFGERHKGKSMGSRVWTSKCAGFPLDFPLLKPILGPC